MTFFTVLTYLTLPTLLVLSTTLILSSAARIVDEYPSQSLAFARFLCYVTTLIVLLGSFTESLPVIPTVLGVTTGICATMACRYKERWPDNRAAGGGTVVSPTVMMLMTGTKTGAIRRWGRLILSILLASAHHFSWIHHFFYHREPDLPFAHLLAFFAIGVWSLPFVLMVVILGKDGASVLPVPITAMERVKKDVLGTYFGGTSYRSATYSKVL